CVRDLLIGDCNSGTDCGLDVW
nr:immunoglobulin heavy chain junction region [Macaca mulatta]MOW98280.1 immunoglobulin heavy chain junction region [Macaca mulatta]MOW99039.1 immunoglobulin heavy chain junction region [Macaca mulatta]MOX00533.1 immunoglobulin heavy chain junction region [Macaca mulatta]MOX01399.1 immunoglobulin heavy chain junction region [Macaca mulatta]